MYLLTHGEYSDYTIVAACRTLEQAERIAKASEQTNERLYVEGVEILDDDFELKAVTIYEAGISWRTGREYFSERRVNTLILGRWEPNTLYCRGGERWGVRGVDKEAVLARAKELRAAAEGGQ